MKKTIALLIAGIMLSGSSSAESLLSWDLDTRTVTDNAPSTANAADILAGTLSAGAGAIAVPRGNCLASRDVGAATTINEAIANDTCWGTTVTATSGNAFTPSTFTALVQQSDADSTVIELRSSADDFSSSLGSTALTANVNTPISYDLSSALGGSYESLEFRLYIYNTGAPGAYDTLYIGKVGTTDGVIDFSIEGTTGSAGQRGTLFVIK